MKSMVEGKVCSREFDLGNRRDKLLSYGWNSIGRKPLKIVPKYMQKFLQLQITLYRIFYLVKDLD